MLKLNFMNGKRLNAAAFDTNQKIVDVKILFTAHKTILLLFR